MPSARLYKPLSEWSVTDVDALVEGRIDEGQRLEYKQELNLRTRGDRLEAAKDASGMANASGGLLIYGVEEEELPDGRRIPIRVTPLESGDAQSRVEDVLASSISPKLNFVARTLETDGGYLLLLHVQQRSGPLHMVEGYNQNRYFIRSGLATRPMQAHEVERVFRELRETESRIEELLADLPLIARLAPTRSRAVDLNEMARRTARIEPGAESWVSVVTAAIDAPYAILPMRPALSTDFSVLEVRPSMIGDWEAIGRVAFEIDAHGYVTDVSGGPGTLQYLRLFREGVFEWGTRWVGRGGPLPIQTITFIKNAHDALVYFAIVYNAVGYFGRVRVWIRVENADQSELNPEKSMDFSRAPGTPNVEALSFTEDTNVERLLDDPMPIVHAAMDLIWQGYGLPRCHHFSPESGFNG